MVNIAGKSWDLPISEMLKKMLCRTQQQALWHMTSDFASEVLTFACWHFERARPGVLQIALMLC